MKNATTIQTSNGPLILGASVTLRGLSVEVVDIDAAPEHIEAIDRRAGYVAAATVYGIGNDFGWVGSTLLHAEDVETVRQHVAALVA